MSVELVVAPGPTPTPTDNDNETPTVVRVSLCPSTSLLCVWGTVDTVEEGGRGPPDTCFGACPDRVMWV